MSKTRFMSGRRVIKTSVSEITSENVVDVLNKALVVHNLNQSEIDYLWKYYCGDQPVRHRMKDMRPEICNRIVENHANEIVSFWVGYLCGEPIQYVSRGGGEHVVGQINELNSFMFAEDRAAKDQELVNWLMIGGTAYKLVLPNSAYREGESPFKIYISDPRDTFIVYSNEIGNKPMMGVKCSKDDDGMLHYSVYTENRYYRIDDDSLVEAKPHALGMVPFFEYPVGIARLGAFEIVLPLLDAINDTESNRLDSVEQFVQAYWKFVGCKIDEELFEKFKKQGAIMVPPNDTGGNIDVDLVVKELNQSQIQTLKDDYYNAILTICGIPNRNGGSSTSDTGAAVVLRDGWSLAETRAKAIEHTFKRSEKQMLKLVLKICRDIAGLDIRLTDIDLQFTRRNYENIQSKAQVLTQMLQQDKIHPLLAFQHSGLFVDPESAYTQSMEYYKEQQAKASAESQAVDNGNENGNKSE